MSGGLMATYITYIPLRPHRPNYFSRERDYFSRERDPRADSGGRASLHIGDTNQTIFFSLSLSFSFLNNSP